MPLIIVGFIICAAAWIAAIWFMLNFLTISKVSDEMAKEIHKKHFDKGGKS